MMLIASNGYSQWQSSIVKYDANGGLTYTPDAEGNKIPDFSYAGYKNGTIAIPGVTVQATISPVAGDNTANIQNAINAVAARTPDANGIRGAVLMDAGTYSVSGLVRINASGVVLRGAGSGSDPALNTIIASTGTKSAQPTVIIAGGGNDGSGSSAWSDKSGSNVNITDEVVYVGDKSFTAASTSGFAVGDNIVIVHPKTDAWVNAVDNGGTGETTYWKSELLDIKYNRYITAIHGSTITIDAPVFNTLKKSLSQSYFYKTTSSGIPNNIGIENLRVDILNPLNELPTNPAGDVNNHSANAIWLGKIQDSWIKNVTVLHFSTYGITTSIAARITIDSCSSIDPIGTITGGYRYNFCSEWASQLILITNCYASYARHAYVSNGTSTVSGIVVYKHRADYNYTASEGHRLWSQGLLFDNWTNTNSFDNSEVAAFYNRGNYGSGHGWSAAHSVIWGGTITGQGHFCVQKPPTAQNYAIGCMADVSGSGPFPGPAGYIEGAGTAGISPASLYLTQLNDRKTYFPVTGVTVSSISSPVSVGSTVRLTATVSPSNATNKLLHWTSSNTSVATVDLGGLVTAVSIGTAAITVTTQDGGKSAAATITTIAQVLVTGVSLSPAAATIITGNTQQLTATLSPENASNKNVTWTSSNTAVATVNELGLVTAVAPGTTTITVTTQDGGKMATSAITVNQRSVKNLISNCDTTTGWTSSNSLTVNTVDKKEGTGCLQSVGAKTDDFKGVFSPPINTGVTVAAGRLQFWYYVSDVSLFTSSNQIEFGSGGKADINEFNWDIGTLVNGWNLITLPFSSAGVSGGTPDLSAINWMRIYHFKTGSVTTRLDQIVILDGSVSAVEDVSETAPGKIPTGYGLLQNYPNPFNPSTTIRYQLPVSSHVTLEVYDVLGQVVATPVNGTRGAGYHTAVFDGSDLSSGIYYARMVAQTQDGKGVVRTAKLSLVK